MQYRNNCSAQQQVNADQHIATMTLQQNLKVQKKKKKGAQKPSYLARRKQAAQVKMFAKAVKIVSQNREQIHFLNENKAYSDWLSQS